MTMAMTQDDIRRHYEQSWRQTLEKASGVADLAYSNPVEDAVMYPIYESLLRDAGVRVDGGAVLDVGAGAGRWARFFLSRFQPRRFVGIDFAASSIDLLRKWHDGRSDVRGADGATANAAGPCVPEFLVADITQPGLRLPCQFDLINIANVLFHIPEPDRFDHALRNLAANLAPDGRIVTTEYLPHPSRRTKWMLVRRRYDMAEAAARVGLRIAHIRAGGFFSNDPMGLEGPDTGLRARFNAVRARMQVLWNACATEETRRAVFELFVEVEGAVMTYCAENTSQVNFPSQKLVVLARAG